MPIAKLLSRLLMNAIRQNTIKRSGQMKKKKKITIRGIVIPETWNESGEISTLSIVTYTEKKYLVGKNEEAGRLKAFLRKQVLAEGTMTQNGEQQNIMIERFEPDEFKPGDTKPRLKR